jgi:hypothetical protein
MAGDDLATVAALDAARAVFRRHIESILRELESFLLERSLPNRLS